MTLPPRLYKYRSLSGPAFERTEQIFLRDEIYFSPLGSLNDPSEGRHGLVMAAWNDTAMLNPEVQDALATIVRDADEKATKFMATIGVLSLSEKPDDVVMWSHYADEHRGICLEFDSSISDTPFYGAHPVAYSGKTPTLNVLGPVGGMELAKNICLSKADQWQYEKEWRALVPASGARPFPRVALTGVILGARISVDHRQCIKDWLALRSPRPRLLQADLKGSAYGLDIRPAQ